ncbi:MAG TPA: phage tail protein, partial [Nitrosopumilaceae archaeon]|nr:phage tail protein [Nitrosopumilaceae archaeon]
IQVFDSAGNIRFQFGTLGTDIGQFTSPQSIAVDSSNRIIVADTNNNRIQVFSSAGNPLFQFGTSGTGIGQFNHPDGIAVDSSNEIIVADTNNNRIQVFDSAGNVRFQFGTAGTGAGQFTNPQSVTVDSSNEIIVADTNNNRVQVFSSAGNFLFNFGTAGTGDGQFSSPQSVVDSSNEIIVADTNNNRIQVFSSQTPTLTVNPTSGPPGMQVTLNGDGYDPGVQVEIDLIEPNVLVLADTTTDNLGHLTATVVIPANVIAPFSASISAHEIANPSMTASIPFNIILPTIPPSVSITIFPAPAVVGTPETLIASINDPGCPTCTTFSYAWTLVSRPAGSSSALSDPSVSSPSFTPDLPGAYLASLTVTDQLGDVSAQTFLTISASSCGTCVPTVSPTASPNPDTVGTVVNLDANPGDTGCPACIQFFTYQWTLTSPPGSSSVLSNPTIRNPTFAPDMTGTYQLSVIAKDSQGQNSSPMFITVSAVPSASKLVYTAGTAQTLIAGMVSNAITVQMQDSAGNPVNAPAGGTTVNLDSTSGGQFSASSSPFTAVTSVTIPVGSSSISFYFKHTESGHQIITASSPGLTSASTTFTVIAPLSVTPAIAPTPVIVGTTETLSASITDPNCPTCSPTSFSYAWSLVSRPAGSLASLSSTTFFSPTSIPDVPGTYDFSLTVTDGQGFSSAPSVLHVLASPCGTCVPTVSPTASPNPDTVGTVVKLDANPGDAGCPACISLFTYHWSLTSPPSSTSVLSDPTIRNPTFAPDTAGTYQLSVTATDSVGHSSVPMFIIVSGVTAPIPPTITAPITVTPGQSYIASVTARPGMTYAWTISGGTIPGSANTPSIIFTAGTTGTLTLSATEKNAAGDTSAPGSVSIAVVGNDNEKGKTLKANILKYNLDVDVNGITTGSSWFHEVTGLGKDTDITEYKEGGKNNGPPKHTGPAVITKITLNGEFAATTSVPDNYVKNLFKDTKLKNEKNNNPTQLSSNVLNISLDCNSITAGGVTFQRVTDQNNLQGNFVITKFVWSNLLINTDKGKNGLSDWISDVTNGKNIRKNISITLLSSNPNTAGHDYNFHECFPSQFSNPRFDSKASDFGMESITLQHEGASRIK